MENLNELKQMLDENCDTYNEPMADVTPSDIKKIE